MNMETTDTMIAAKFLSLRVENVKLGGMKRPRVTPQVWRSNVESTAHGTEVKGPR